MAVYWEDVSEGTDIPELKKNCSTQQLVMYAGASLDFYQIHYDKDFALNNDLPGVIIHGALKKRLAGAARHGLGGPRRTAPSKLSVQYRGMDVTDEDLVLTGTVARKYEADGKRLVDCNIWLQNSKGEKTTPGAATLELPTR